MRKILIFMLTFLLINVALTKQKFYYANVTAQDNYSNGISGVNVKFTIEIYNYDTQQNETYWSFGTTNSSGFVQITVEDPTSNSAFVECWTEIMESPSDYTLISSSGTSSSVSYIIYPLYTFILDKDKDYIEDAVEAQIANKFSPVLHKHSYDKQAGLANFEDMIDQAVLKAWNLSGGLVLAENTGPLHVWAQDGDLYLCSYGVDSTPYIWRLEFDDYYNYLGASIGNRPIYYHVYKSGTYTYVQYWYYLNMNDVSEQSDYQTWHQGDWEHVSIRLTKNGSVYTPNAVNFFRHTGGRTHYVSDCWWSSSNSPTYSGLQQGYDSNHTHLHIWLAANSHASYNRYSSVYKIKIKFGGMATFDNYWDNADYTDTSNKNKYFEYDNLIKLGEIAAMTNYNIHGTIFNYHLLQIGNDSKEWGCFRGYVGKYWSNAFGSTPSPRMPYIGDSHEYYDFTSNYNVYGFGNQSSPPLIEISWIADPSDGDEQ
ncbi:hypothetical protein ACFL4T_14150 [candidate division KSB1 bacterium]